MTFLFMVVLQAKPNVLSADTITNDEDEAFILIYLRWHGTNL